MLAASDRRRFSEPRKLHLVAQQFVGVRVELLRVPAFDLHLAIRALTPGLAAGPAALVSAVVRRSLDRIRDRGEEDIGLRLAYMLDGRLDVFHLLSFVAPHQKHSALNPALPAHLDGLLHLLDLDAAIHGVEHALRSALRADPDAKAAEFGQQIEHLCVEPIGARDAFEGNTQMPRRRISAAYSRSHPWLIVKTSSDTQTMSGVYSVSSHSTSSTTMSGIAAAVGLAVDLMAAPAALVRAAARGDEVDRSLTVVASRQVST